MSRPYIQVDSVRKVYNPGRGQTEAIKLVSLDVAEGEFVSIIGPSGCGKSTLLMMIGGLEPVTAGRIDIDGQEVAGPRRGSGVVFQDATLLPWKTVLENVLFPIKIQRKQLTPYRERARELLDLVGLTGFSDKRPHELSGGMRQRAAICRALIDDPDILLMDEPFSALDAITRDELNVALADIWERYRKTALFITHSIREAVFLSDRVLVMTQRPATIAKEMKVTFNRPRDRDIEENPEFNRICAQLRSTIEAVRGHAQ